MAPVRKRRTLKRITPEATIIRLSAKDQRRFAELLLDPPELSPAMKRARKAHAELIESV